MKNQSKDTQKEKDSPKSQTKAKFDKKKIILIIALIPIIYALLAYFIPLKSKFLEVEEVPDDLTENIKFIEKAIKYAENTSFSDYKNYKKSEHPKVSVIIAVYNIEEDLRKAIRSVQLQTLKDIDIVLVNDYSQDNSWKIMEEEAKLDSRIVLVNHTENKKAFYTLYDGVMHSKGKYMHLLDPDDLLCNEKSLEILYNAAEEHKVELVYHRLMNGHPGDYKLFFYPDKKEDKELLFYAPNFKFKVQKYVNPPVNCHALYSRNLLDRSYKIIGERIHTPLNFINDLIFTQTNLREAKNYYVVQKALYYYNYPRIGSITDDLNSFKEHEAKKALSYGNQFLEGMQLLYDITGDSYEEKYSFFYMLRLYIRFHGLDRIKNEEYKKKVQKFCKKHMNDKYFPKEIKEFFGNYCRKYE